MKIIINIVDLKNNDRVLQSLGQCITDNPARALQMYEDELDVWLARGYCAELEYKIEGINSMKQSHFDL